METSRPHCDLLNQSHGHSAAQASVLFQVFMISLKSDTGSNGEILFRQLKPKGHAAFRELDSSSAKALRTPWSQGGSLLLLPSALTFPPHLHECCFVFHGNKIKTPCPQSSFLAPYFVFHPVTLFHCPCWILWSHTLLYTWVLILNRVETRPVSPTPAHLQYLAW